ncbi:hypothetical protein COO60DRAFT_1498015 [Scenedesmus sp. NREL 46B-D3]|nr:hypothetical protein COO60DRAFT_1498015 [Scenedesmus sp. NREL 46B-D3]
MGALLSTTPTDKLPLRGLMAGLLTALTEEGFEGVPAALRPADACTAAMPGMRDDSLPAAPETTRAAPAAAAAAPAGPLLAAAPIAACTAGKPAALPALLLATLALLPERPAGIVAAALAAPGAAAASPRGLGGALALGEAGTDAVGVARDALRDAAGLPGTLRPTVLLGAAPAGALGELAAAAGTRGDALGFGLASCCSRGEMPMPGDDSPAAATPFADALADTTLLRLIGAADAGSCSAVGNGSSSGGGGMRRCEDVAACCCCRASASPCASRGCGGAVSRDWQDPACCSRCWPGAGSSRGASGCCCGASPLAAASPDFRARHTSDSKCCATVSTYPGLPWLCSASCSADTACCGAPASPAPTAVAAAAPAAASAPLQPLLWLIAVAWLSLLLSASCFSSSCFATSTCMKLACSAKASSCLRSTSAEMCSVRDCIAAMRCVRGVTYAATSGGS